MNPEQIKCLDEINFDWNPLETLWGKMYQDLVKYKRLHGHCNVPTQGPNKTPLGSWVANQRIKKNKLSPERINRLNALGFAWNPSEEIFEKRFFDLTKYKNIWGHCNVPRDWSENQHLSKWVDKLRQIKSRLSLEQIKRLDSLGFDWNPRKNRWEKRFLELIEYEKKYGHCKVLRDWPKNPALARWVSMQRYYRNKGKLSPERIKRLEEIGFEW